MWRPTRAVGRSAELADDPFQLQLAGVPEDILGVALDVNLQWIAPQVVDPEAEEVEGIEEDYLVVVRVPDEVKVRPAVRATGNCLAIDHAGLARKLRQRFHDEWEPLGQVVG
jgi:hypothetical protein